MHGASGAHGGNGGSRGGADGVTADGSVGVGGTGGSDGEMGDGVDEIGAGATSEAVVVEADPVSWTTRVTPIVVYTTREPLYWMPTALM